MDTIKVKAKPGFNIFVKDLGLSLRSETKDWVEVDKEKFDASIDVKGVRKFILVDGEDIVAEEKADTENKEVEVKVTNEGAFVMAGPEEKKPEGIFVAQPKTSPEANSTVILDQTPIQNSNTRILEDVVAEEVVAPEEVPVEETVKAQEAEVATEVTETVEPTPVKEEVKVAPKATETKTTAKKPANRTKANRKTK